MRYLLFLLFPFVALAQSRQPNAAEIRLKLKKLNFLGSVLYVAAHPDDENTRVITYFANERLATSAYLSLTRGDGGQNLIGPELRDELGLIRTQELLAARRLDGGKQFFTRANDFGFSKSADETFSIWGKDKILADVVRIYRQFQPDVIITRFPPDARAGHGHHTASAMLAREAFDKAAQATVFPDQLAQLPLWQPKTIYTNTGRWWNQTINENTPGVLTLNVGGYSALLGTSYPEIAAVSRSQHKSQGFGSRGTRGDQLEFLEFVKGEQAKKEVFEGVNTTWTRVPGGEKVKTLVDKAITSFDVEHPETILPQLLAIRAEIDALPAGVWKTRKLEEVEDLIKSCTGLFAEATADHYWAVPGKTVAVSVEVINRSAADVKLVKVSSTTVEYDTVLNAALTANKTLTFKTKKTLRSATGYSAPYWLQQPHTLGTFTIPDSTLIGKPESGPPVTLTCEWLVQGVKVITQVPVVHKTVDPVKGELNRVVEVVPPAFVNLEKEVYVFSAAPKLLVVKVKSAGSDRTSGVLTMQLPAGWRSEPANILVELTKRGEEQSKTFTVYPNGSEGRFTIGATLEIDGVSHGKSLRTITYDHIPPQTLLPPAQALAVRLDLKKEGSVIGYIKGAGDEVPEALRNMGYEVWEMANTEITPDNLKKLDAVVLGIRAVNTNDRLRFVMNDLLEYVKGGGTMLVQYNTNFDYETDVFSPYPITLSRDRVTEENANVTITNPKHFLLNTPNQITSTDFDGWVQERGLYFPNKWDTNYEAILSMNDKGETPKEGSVLVARYGEGYYIYTGLSFFRELPEGVPGAYKLFANLISAGKPKKLSSSKSKNRSR